MADGRGGARKGAGRRPKLTTIIREKALEQANGDAEYALGLIIGVMRDGANDMGMRWAAAKEVMDRVWGKSTYRAEVSGPDGGAIEVTDARDKILDLVARRTAAGREGGDPSQDDASGEGSAGV